MHRLTHDQKCCHPEEPHQPSTLTGVLMMWWSGWAWMMELSDWRAGSQSGVWWPHLTSLCVQVSVRVFMLFTRLSRFFWLCSILFETSDTHNTLTTVPMHFHWPLTLTITPFCNNIVPHFNKFSVFLLSYMCIISFVVAFELDVTGDREAYYTGRACSPQHVKYTVKFTDDTTITAENSNESLYR